MKKTTTLLTLILLFAVAAYAGPVDPEKALEIANSFWKNIPGAPVAAQLLEVGNGPSKSAGRDAAPKADAQYYIFSAQGDGGFVIVSGDDRLAPVVGYSTEAPVGEMPPALVDWLAGYSNYVDDVRAGVVEPAALTATAGKRIEPMLKTSWNQGSPYNNYCPEINGQKTPTGCTATAQIMKFHEWPERPTKDVDWYNNITGESELVEISKNTYDWANMLPHYRDGYTAGQADAVAQLMVDVGKAIGSNYALSGTGSSATDASYALVNVFDYSPGITVVRRSEYTEDEYVTIIRENLEASQPLLYTGNSQSYGSGHAFVCDGIDENNLLHIDWGWDGAYNGYFNMTYMSPGGTGIGGGDGCYNVAQSFVANIRPRAGGEPDAEGVPGVYRMDVVDVNAGLDAENRPGTLLEQTVGYAGGRARVRLVAGLMNWSHSSVDLSMVLGFEKDGELVAMHRLTDVETMSFWDFLGYYITLPISNVLSDDNYFEEGTYTVVLYYGDAEGNLHYVRGAENGLKLEVNDKSVTLSKILPEIEVTEVAFSATPLQKGDRIAFDAKFRSNNGRSATVLITPVLNKVHPDGSCTGTLLDENVALIQVYDDREIPATFDALPAIPDDGEFFISFKYNLKNEFIDHGMLIDRAKLVDISGKSDNFIVEALHDGAVLSMTAATVASRIVANGDELEISVNVKNIASTDDAYDGSLAIFVENAYTAEKYALMTEPVAGLAKDSVTGISYKSTDYYPVLRPGKYVVYTCERKGEEWEKIRQSAPECNFYIDRSDAVLPYANAMYVINGGENVRRGSEFEVLMELICTEGDYDGFIKVTNENGPSVPISSDYIPVSLKKGVASQIIVPCSCRRTAALKQYRLNVTCYDNMKNKTGILSHNTIKYPGNGYFRVADATAVDAVREGAATVTAGNGRIVVGGDAAVVNVYSLDGRTVYSGAAATVQVGNGVYIVNTVDAGGNVAAVKVLVK